VKELSPTNVGMRIIIRYVKKSISTLITIRKTVKTLVIANFTTLLGQTKTKIIGLVVPLWEGSVILKGIMEVLVAAAVMKTIVMVSKVDIVMILNIKKK
jgi:hypothetical protein